MSFKNRLTFLEYYWENMKVDMAKVLMSETKQRAKQLSYSIFAMKHELKDKFTHAYARYCK